MLDNIENSMQPTTFTISGGSLTISGSDILKYDPSLQNDMHQYIPNIQPLQQTINIDALAINPGAIVFPIDYNFGYFDNPNQQMMNINKTEICPDCKGTKEYVGFNKIEPCAKCNGIGTIPSYVIENVSFADEKYRDL